MKFWLLSCIIFAFNLLSINGQITKIKNIDVVFVKGGWFNMGGAIINIRDTTIKDISTFPIHKVYLKDFYIGKYEITNNQYCNFLNNNGFNYAQIFDRINVNSRECKIKYKNNKCYVSKGYEDYPVTFINFYAAEEFCKEMGGRLPTEAEWEYAARGGSQSEGYTYSGSNDIKDVGVTKDNYYGIKKVGSLKPNELGIYDMSGNVRELCSDWFQPDYFKHTTDSNPKGPSNPIKLNEKPFMYKVAKGGAFNREALEGVSIISLRGCVSTEKRARGSNVGFRICFPKN